MGTACVFYFRGRGCESDCGQKAKGEGDRSGSTCQAGNWVWDSGSTCQAGSWVREIVGQRVRPAA